MQRVSVSRIALDLKSDLSGISRGGEVPERSDFRSSAMCETPRTLHRAPFRARGESLERMSSRPSNLKPCRRPQNFLSEGPGFWVPSLSLTVFCFKILNFLLKKSLCTARSRRPRSYPGVPQDTRKTLLGAEAPRSVFRARWAPGVRVKVREPLGHPWAPGVKVKVRES